MYTRILTCSLLLAATPLSALAQATFTKITTGAIVTDGGSSSGCAWGDYDNDGWLDLFVGNTQADPNLLYRNRGDGSFEAHNDSPLSKEGGSSIGCAWGDYDNDGFLDLFVAHGGADSAHRRTACARSDITGSCPGQRSEGHRLCH